MSTIGVEAKKLFLEYKFDEGIEFLKKGLAEKPIDKTLEIQIRVYSILFEIERKGFGNALTEWIYIRNNLVKWNASNKFCKYLIDLRKKIYSEYDSKLGGLISFYHNDVKLFVPKRMKSISPYGLFVCQDLGKQHIGFLKHYSIDRILFISADDIDMEPYKSDGLEVRQLRLDDIYTNPTFEEMMNVGKSVVKSLNLGKSMIISSESYDIIYLVVYALKRIYGYSFEYNLNLEEFKTYPNTNEYDVTRKLDYNIVEKRYRDCFQEYTKKSTEIYNKKQTSEKVPVYTYLSLFPVQTIGTSAESTTPMDIVITEKLDGWKCQLYNRRAFYSYNISHHVIVKALEEFYNKEIYPKIVEKGWEKLVIYGELMTAIKNIKYTKIPTSYFVFDILDKETNKYLPWEEMEKICLELRLPTVPILFKQNSTTMLDLISVISDINGQPSCLSTMAEPVSKEGIVVRSMEEDAIRNRRVWKMVPKTLPIIGAIPYKWERANIGSGRISVKREENKLPSFLIVTGKPGSGKTTFVKKITKEYPDVKVIDGNDEKLKQKIKELSPKHNVIIDGGSFETSMREEYRQLANSPKDATLVEIRMNDEECVKRLMKETPRKTSERMVEHFNKFFKKVNASELFRKIIIPNDALEKRTLKKFGIEEDVPMDTDALYKEIDDFDRKHEATEEEVEELTDEQGRIVKGLFEDDDTNQLKAEKVPLLEQIDIDKERVKVIDQSIPNPTDISIIPNIFDCRVFLNRRESTVRPGEDIIEASEFQHFLNKKVIIEEAPEGVPFWITRNLAGAIIHSCFKEGTSVHKSQYDFEAWLFTQNEIANMDARYIIYGIWADKKTKSGNNFYMNMVFDKYMGKLVHDRSKVREMARNLKLPCLPVIGYIKHASALRFADYESDDSQLYEGKVKMIFAYSNKKDVAIIGRLRY